MPHNWRRIPAPQAKKLQVTKVVHGVEMHDEYSWLRDGAWPEVADREILDHLTAENAYAEAILAASRPLAQQIKSELDGRVPEEERSYPIADGSYAYYKVVRRDQDYPVYRRCGLADPAIDQELLDLNQMSQGHEYFSVPFHVVSPDHRLLAYAVDCKGDERFAVLVKDIDQDQIIDAAVTNAFPSIVWDRAGRGFFYVRASKKWRANKVYYHALGSAETEDQLIYEELDQVYRVDIEGSGSREHLFITSSSADCCEIWVAPLEGVSDAAEFRPTKVLPRELGALATITQASTNLYLLINDAGPNYRLLAMPVSRVQSQSLKSNLESVPDGWSEVIPHDPGLYLTAAYGMQTHLVVAGKRDGLPQLRVYVSDVDGLQLSRELEFTDPCYDLAVVAMPYASPTVRYIYSSLRQPWVTMEYDLVASGVHVRREYPMPPGFNPDDYEVERLLVPSRDGRVTIPVSTVRKKQLGCSPGNPAHQPPPLLLYGYGSYGLAVEPGFRSWVLSLLDRGVRYAIAHIRGGDDLGHSWYEEAKMLTKKRTFEDFIDVADSLVAQGYAAAGQIAIHGGSAGGMLVGACVNQRPELYAAVVAEVPFVDVCNTMLDATLPLTPGEYMEWGNPEADPEYFTYIRSYSPYDNIAVQPYPHVFATAGLTDPRVGYWEAVKWVARLRAANLNPNTVAIIKTNMSAGHGGGSARSQRYAEIAEQYAFVIDILRAGEEIGD